MSTSSSPAMLLYDPSAVHGITVDAKERINVSGKSGLDDLSEMHVFIGCGRVVSETLRRLCVHAPVDRREFGHVAIFGIGASRIVTSEHGDLRLARTTVSLATDVGGVRSRLFECVRVGYLGTQHIVNVQSVRAR